MAVILGSVTTVTIVSPDNKNSGFISVNWNINRQPTRLWELGSWTPWKTQVGKTITISLNIYAEAIDPVDLIRATSCADSTAIKHIVINPASCGDDVDVVDEDSMYITSYSYSKGDATGFGTESWSFQKWVEADVSGDSFIPVPEPSFVLQGIAEGNRQGDVGNGTTDLGIRFDGEPGSPSALSYDEHVVTGDQGSVSAGFPGLGNADTTEIGLVDRIGGGLLEAGGRIGQSSANVPHQPIYTAAIV